MTATGCVEELTEVAIVQEHVKHDRNLTTGAAKAVDEVATAAASDGKNQRKRGRGKKTKTTTVDGAATADGRVRVPYPDTEGYRLPGAWHPPLQPVPQPVLCAPGRCTARRHAFASPS